VGILVTHHHADHVGGVDALRSRLRGSVYGPAHEKIPTPFVRLTEGQHVDVLGLSFKVLDVPGHTAGHIAYVQTEAAATSLLFCGDTLFSGGCGRLFEGTPSQMSASLAKFAALPADTRVCCTHEYTLSNLRFALAVEPDNAALVAYNAHCMALRAAGTPTLPSAIGLELQINPFMRCGVPEVAAAARIRGAVDDDSVSVLAALRTWKNNFR
jgi:hydroxyacylglutathione hydrolase